MENLYKRLFVLIYDDDHIYNISVVICSFLAVLVSFCFGFPIIDALKMGAILVIPICILMAIEAGKNKHPKEYELRGVSLFFNFFGRN